MPNGSNKAYVLLLLLKGGLALSCRNFAGKKKNNKRGWESPLNCCTKQEIFTKHENENENENETNKINK